MQPGHIQCPASPADHVTNHTGFSRMHRRKKTIRPRRDKKTRENMITQNEEWHNGDNGGQSLEQRVSLVQASETADAIEWKGVAMGGVSV